MLAKIREEPRKRAPSKRALQTRAKILDAAEAMFAERGFEGASLRDIAALADVPVGLVHHHGGGKEELFRQAVARRAHELAQIRIACLEDLLSTGDVSLRAVLHCFIAPYVELAQTGGAGWIAYGRLVAMVSIDARWRAIAAECFDPTAGRFIDEIAALFPGVDRALIATAQVYFVAAMLAFLNSAWRVDAMSPGGQVAGLDQLIEFSAAGIEAMVARSQSA